MNKASNKKSHEQAAHTENKKTSAQAKQHDTPEHPDDRPKRDDDDLSALLQTSDPEGSSRGKPGAGKK